jgi:hypothetical protein
MLTAPRQKNKQIPILAARVCGAGVWCLCLISFFVIYFLLKQNKRRKNRDSKGKCKTQPTLSMCKVLSPRRKRIETEKLARAAVSALVVLVCNTRNEAVLQAKLLS